MTTRYACYFATAAAAAVPFNVGVTRYRNKQTQLTGKTSKKFLNDLLNDDCSTGGWLAPSITHSAMY